MLIGFDNLKNNLTSLYQKQKLHHAILLHGKRGIGKASFINSLVGEFLDSKNNFHPDFFKIEKEEEKKEITIDKIRKIFDFVNQTSASSGNKFILIDSACQLNRSSANALLKVLEEPQKNNFLFLVAHNLNAVLPTIRSRCSCILVEDLSKENFNKIIQNKDRFLNDEEISFLSEISEISPAFAIRYRHDLIDLYSDFLNSIYQKNLSEKILSKITGKDFSLEVFERIILFFINRFIKYLNNIEINFYLEEQKIFNYLAKKIGLEKLFSLVENFTSSLKKTSTLNLDKKLVITNIFNQICYE
jgi:DNA polymerase-3 subunit delta'